MVIKLTSQEHKNRNKPLHPTIIKKLNNIFEVESNAKAKTKRKRTSKSN